MNESIKTAFKMVGVAIISALTATAICRLRTRDEVNSLHMLLDVKYDIGYIDGYLRYPYAGENDFVIEHCRGSVRSSEGVAGSTEEGSDET